MLILYFFFHLFLYAFECLRFVIVFIADCGYGLLLFIVVGWWLRLLYGVVLLFVLLCGLVACCVCATLWVCCFFAGLPLCYWSVGLCTLGVWVLIWFSGCLMSSSVILGCVGVGCRWFWLGGGVFWFECFWLVFLVWLGCDC